MVEVYWNWSSGSGRLQLEHWVRKTATGALHQEDWNWSTDWSWIRKTATGALGQEDWINWSIGSGRLELDQEDCNWSIGSGRLDPTGALGQEDWNWSIGSGRLELEH